MLSFGPGSDVVQHARDLTRARERFLESGKVPVDVHPVIAASWRRSLEVGIAPDHGSRSVDGESVAGRLGERRRVLTPLARTDQHAPEMPDARPR